MKTTLKTDLKAPLGGMELKYCERCGNLWFRFCGTRQTLCSPCAQAEEQLLTGRKGSLLSLWTRLRAEVNA